MSDGPDTRVVALAAALLRIAYPWHDPAVDDPPVMEVGDLSDSGTATPWGLAAAILAALPPDWCGHPPDTDEDWRRLREIEKAARILVKGKSAERYVPLKRALGYWPDVDE
jgi:hypothetical protein